MRDGAARGRARGPERRRAAWRPRPDDGRAGGAGQALQLRRCASRSGLVVRRGGSESCHVAHDPSRRRGNARSVAARVPDARRPAPDAPGPRRRQLRRPAIRAAAGIRGREPAARPGPARSRRGRDAVARSRGSLLWQRRAVRPARPGRPDRADLEPEPVRRALRARVQEPSGRRREPRLRALRGRADHCRLSPGQPVEPRLYGAGGRRGARLLSDGRHAERDRDRVHRADRASGRAPRVGVRPLGLDLLRAVHRGVGPRGRPAPARRGHSLRRLQPGFVLAARLHVVRLRVGLGASAGSQAAHGRASQGRLSQLPVDQPLCVAPERSLSRGRDARLLPSEARRQRLPSDRLEPAHRARHGALRDRRLHEPGGRGVVPPQAHRAARARRRFVQAGLRRGDSRRRGLRQRAHRRRDAQPLSAPVPEGSLRRHACPRRARRGLVAQRRAGCPALSGPLVGRPGVHVHRSRQHLARRPRRVDERPRVLEPRHGWLLGRSVAGALRALVAVRLFLGAEPIPWGDAARAVALRGRGAPHLSPVRPAPEPPRALRGELRLAGVGGRRAADAADGDGVSRRSGRVRLRPAVLPRA